MRPWGKKDRDPPGLKRRRRGKPGLGGKQAVLGLVQRGGKSRMMVMDGLTTKDVWAVLEQHVSTDSRLMTDEGTSHNWHFASHERVKHGAKEYVRGDASTNTVEGFFGVFKRGMRGTYQHCGEQHLQRYLDEFNFRFSNRSALGVSDSERAQRAIKGGEGKRLTYQDTRSAK